MIIGNILSKEVNPTRRLCLPGLGRTASKRRVQTIGGGVKVFIVPRGKGQTLMRIANIELFQMK
jgi:hypothetical protein